MEKIRIIEKTKGMDRGGAILLLEYHRGLQETKMKRLRRQLDKATGVHDAIYNEIGRRQMEEAN